MKGCASNSIGNHTARHQINRFQFESVCQVQSVPKTVLALTSELTDGEMTSSDQPSQEALSVAQIFVLQTSKPPKQRANANTPSPDITECNRLLWYIVYKGVPAPLFKAPTP